MIPSIARPRPNLTIVKIGLLELAFSYDTIVAFRYDRGWHVSENVWSRTTGAHLNYLADKDARIPYDKWKRLLDERLASITEPQIGYIHE